MISKQKLKRQPFDWHPADVKAALAKRGYSLSEVARENGYSVKSPSQVFLKPWPAMEAVIAKTIGIQPQSIWPSRYDEYGNPLGMVRLARARRVCNG